MKAFVDVMRGIDGGATMKMLKEGVEKKDIQILKQVTIYLLLSIIIIIILVNNWIWKLKWV